MRNIFIILAAVLAAMAVIGCGETSAPVTTPAAAPAAAPAAEPAATAAPAAAPAAPVTPAAVQYTCPMHPEVITNAPGVCPKCNMALVVKQ